MARWRFALLAWAIAIVTLAAGLGLVARERWIARTRLNNLFQHPTKSNIALQLSAEGSGQGLPWLLIGVVFTCVGGIATVVVAVFAAAEVVQGRRPRDTRTGFEVIR